MFNLICMLPLKKYLLAVLYRLKVKFSLFRLRIGRKFRLIRTVMIMPYQGFGNKSEIFFLGRVLRDRGIGLSTLEDSRWKNFSRMYKRFMTWEIPFKQVKATFGSVAEMAITDGDGYFEFRINPADPEEVSAPWQEIKLELINRVAVSAERVTAINRIFIASKEVEFGVISDIDDTIVPTGATRMWEMIKTTFFGNAHTRVPFPGVSAFYQALAKGSAGKVDNPFFYVSSSPWNLYDFLMEFMHIHEIPHGPLMLRDIGLSRENFFSGSHTEHKLTQVERIFEIISDIPFILVGDSGQHDAEIYHQVIRDFPGRVKMVYIRDVHPVNHSKVMKIAEEVKKLGVEMMLVKDTVEAARHAASQGWIVESDIWNVAEEKREEEDGRE
jgi:phosphatidate phosphatase APP1